jgi:alcohol dehydrogenase YqhD (iron-dependent ADH family)
VLEIGSSFGACSVIICKALAAAAAAAQQAAAVANYVGLDTSEKCISACEALALPATGGVTARFQCLDVLAEREALCQLVAVERPSLVVVDVGGTRALPDVMEVLELVVEALAQSQQQAATANSKL